jgi:hypothetical protein
MVTTMTTDWTLKYHGDVDFMTMFSDEQSFVDAMFVIIMLVNFGVFLDADVLC